MKFTLFWVCIVCLSIYSVGAIIYGTMSGILENLTMQILASIALFSYIFGAGKFLLHFIEEKEDQPLYIALMLISLNIIIGGMVMQKLSLIITGLCLTIISLTISFAGILRK